MAGFIDVSGKDRRRLIASFLLNVNEL